MQGKCQNMNHDDSDNPMEYVTLVLEWNEERKVFIDRKPEYWCHDCLGVIYPKCHFAKDYGKTPDLPSAFPLMTAGRLRPR